MRVLGWKESSRGTGRRQGARMARVMAVAVDTTVLLRFKTALGDLAYSLETAEDGTRALEELCFHAYDLVVCNYPLPHLLFRHFLQQLRHGSCASRHCSLMVLAIPELLSGAARFAGHGANAVLPRWVSRADLERAVRGLLHVPERLLPSSELRVRLHNPDGSLVPVEDVVNLSVNGLLVRSAIRPMIGSTLTTLISHPKLGRPLQLPARVVRHTLPGREPVEGFAISFTGRPLEPALDILARQPRH